MWSLRPAARSRRPAAGGRASRSAACSPRGPSRFTTLSPDLHYPAPPWPQDGRKTPRMKKKRETITRIALVAGVALLAGCGGGRGGDEDASATTAAAGTGGG